MATWKCSIKKGINEIPGRIGVYLVGRFDAHPSVLDSLEEGMDEILDSIRRMVARDAGKLGPGESASYTVSSCQGKIGFELWGLPESVMTSQAQYYGMEGFPIFRTGKEDLKFGDIVCSKLRQMIHGEINVLTVSSSSDSHRERDLKGAIYSLSERARKGDDCFFSKKGFPSATEFLTELEALSGVLFRGAWLEALPDRNTLWCNENAECQIPQDIQDVLRKLR